MSKLVVSRYHMPSAEERRAAQRKIALIREMLQRCVDLREALERFESVEGEDWAETLRRYQQALGEQRWEDFVGDYNRLYDTLPAIEAQLEERIAAARGRRLRLELTASTLAGSSSRNEDKATFEKIAREAKRMRSDRLDAATMQIEAAFTRLLDAAPGKSATASSAAQLDLARSLIHSGSEPLARIGSPTVPKSVPAVVQERDARVTGLSHNYRCLRRMQAISSGVFASSQLEQNASQRSLLLDSLVMEIAGHVAARRTSRDVSRLVAEAFAELSPLDGPAVEALRAKLPVAHAEADIIQARTLLRDAQSLAETEARCQDGLLARAAIVKALSELGYEVRVQGETWEERGHLEVRRPDEPNYDVLLSAAANGRVQSKVRAYAHGGRSEGVNRRDVEVEQGWCDDLKVLNSLIEAQGFAAEIEHEEGPGTAAQKPLPSRVDVRDGQSTPKARTRFS